MNDTPETSAESTLPAQLSAIEARVLGSLVEKAATTPDVYPLTLNNLVLACNQKTAREPVTQFNSGDIGHALRQLENRHLVHYDFGARAERYSHRLDRGYDLTQAQTALLALLLLRGPQTLNELLTRSERLHRFEDVDAVRHTLERLSDRSLPLVVRLQRGPGQREDRYAHRLCGEPEYIATRNEPNANATPDSRNDALLARIEALEARVQALEGLLSDTASDPTD
ncbi:MAG: YceH family protein [Lysobacteraceae bacterium]